MSHVFDDDDDELEDEYFGSVQIIEALSQQLGEELNGNRHQQIDFELEKQRIYDETQAIFDEQLKAIKAQAGEAEKHLKSAIRMQNELKNDFEERLRAAEDELEIHRREAKFERENVVAEMIEDHDAKIKRVKEEAEQKLRALLSSGGASGPPLKRKSSAVPPDMETVVLNGDLVSVAVPVADQSVYTILETGELEFVEFIPYPEEKPENGIGEGNCFAKFDLINFDCE